MNKCNEMMQSIFSRNGGKNPQNGCSNAKDLHFISPFSLLCTAVKCE